MNHTKYDRQAQRNEVMFHEWDDKQESNVAEKYINMFGGWFGVLLSVPALLVFAVVLYAVALDSLNFYL